MKKYHILLLCCLLTTLGFGQKKDSLTFNTRQFKNQIGLDVQNILNKVLVSSVVYKRKVKDGKLIDVSQSKYWRFQAFLIGDVYDTQDSVFQIKDRVFSTTKDKDIYLDFSVGREWGKRKWNNFTFYYGVDLFATFIQSDQTFAYNTGSNINPLRFDLNYGDRFVSRNFTVGITPFIGAQIHFTERFFLTIESGLDLFYRNINHTISSTSRSISDIDPFHISYNRFSYYFDQLNMLTVGYYF